ncbi:hypothetical protein E5198_18500 [Pseudomonas sp. A-1]|nr:hypothetical protein E5198_18500 [Pseudomonas sp. A-1]
MNHTATRAAVNTSEQPALNPEAEDAAGKPPCTSTTNPTQALDLQDFFDQLAAGSGAHYRDIGGDVNDFIEMIPPGRPEHMR